MKCNHCGQEINDNAKFCTYCGTPVVQAPETPPVEPAAPAAAPAAPVPSEAPTVPVAPATPVEPAAPAQQEQAYTPAQPPVQQPYYVQPQQQPPKKENAPIFKQWWFWAAIAAVVLLIVGIVFFAGGSDDKDPYDVIVTTEASAEDDAEDSAEDEDSEEEDAEEETEDSEEETDAETEEHDDSYDDYDDGYNYDDSDDYDMVSVMLNEKIAIGETCEITLVDCYWADYIGAAGQEPEDLYGEGAPIDGETYIIVEAKIKNVSGAEITVSDMFTEFVFNEKYTYDDSVEIISEYDSGGFMTSLVTLKPLKEKTVYFICSVPDEMYESTQTAELVFGTDKEFSFEPSWNGKDACDYLYSAKFEAE